MYSFRSKASFAGDEKNRPAEWSDTLYNSKKRHFYIFRKMALKINSKYNYTKKTLK